MKNPDKSIFKILLIYLIFGIAMAYLESAIVVYLRLIYYPHGFQFPIFQIPAKIVFIEVGREAATIIMLWAITRMYSKKFKEQFALFLYSFGVWDIFYYIWLKAFIGWPAGMLEWDILFLIPLPWTSPWPAPVFASLGFIVTAVIVLMYPARFPEKIFSGYEWLAEIFCASAILFTFFYQTENVLAGGIPHYYPWLVFLTAMAAGLFIFFRRFYKGAKKN